MTSIRCRTPRRAGRRRRRTTGARTSGGTSSSSPASSCPNPTRRSSRRTSSDGGCESPVEAQVACWDSPWSSDSAEETRSWLARVRCPTLAIHGDEDRCQPPERSRVFAELTNGELVTVAGAGHLPMAREPVLVNHAIRDFLQRQGLIDDVASEETHAVEVYAGERAPAPQDPSAADVLDPVEPAQACPLPLLAHRARSRPTRPRGRARPAAAGAGHRGRLAGAGAGDDLPRGERRAGPPGLAMARQRVGALRVGLWRARPQRVRRDP